MCLFVDICRAHFVEPISQYARLGNMLPIVIWIMSTKATYTNPECELRYLIKSYMYVI